MHSCQNAYQTNKQQCCFKGKYLSRQEFSHGKIISQQKIMQSESDQSQQLSSASSMPLPAVSAKVPLELAQSGCAYLCPFCPLASFGALELLEGHIRDKHPKQTHQNVNSEDMKPSMDGHVENFLSAMTPLELPSATTIIPSAHSLALTVHSPAASSSSSASNASSVGSPSLALTCKKCPGGRTFADREQLDAHCASTHRERPQYRCAQCGATFSIKRELATHNRIHSGEQPHRCEKCGKEFGTRQLLKKHNMWHTGERSHVCPHCNKAFFQKGHLTQHLMIHKGGRPHQCPLCLKTFIFKFDLNRHLKIHSDREFICTKCAKCFQLERELDEHRVKCKGTGVGGAHRRSSKSSPKKHSIPSLSPMGMDEEKMDLGSAEQVEAGQESSPIDVKLGTVKHEPSPLFWCGTNGTAPAEGIQIGDIVSRLAASLLARQNGISSIGGINGFGPGNEAAFPCLLCPEKFANQTAYLMHWGTVHMPKGMAQKSSLEEPPFSMPFKEEQPHQLQLHAFQPAELCGAQSPKMSPASSSSASTSSTMMPDSLNGQPFEQPFGLQQQQLHFQQQNPVQGCCPNCPLQRQRLVEKERELAHTQAELERIRALFLRLGLLMNAGTAANVQNGGSMFQPEQFSQFLLGHTRTPN